MNKTQELINNLLNNKQHRDIATGRIVPKLSREQLNTLKRFVEYYSHKPSSKGGIIKPKSVLNYLNALRNLGLFLNKPYEQATKKELIRWVNWLADNNKEKTASNWKVALRYFYKWLNGITKPHQFPDIVDDELLKPTRVETPVRPNHLPTKEEVIAMVNSCREPRSKAVIMCMTEGGIRDSELISAQKRDCEFDSVGCKFWIRQSKTKERYVRLIEAAPFLQEWLTVHPIKRDDAPLFVGLSHYNGRKLNPNGINLIIKRAAERAGVKKRVFGHLCRHFAITSRQREGLDIVANAKRHGITTATLEKVYLHYDDKDVDEAYINLKHKKTDEELLKDKEEKEKLAPKKCQYCGHLNPFEVSYCKNCHRPVDLKTFVELDKEKEEKMELLVEEIKREVVQEILSKLDKN